MVNKADNIKKAIICIGIKNKKIHEKRVKFAEDNFDKNTLIIFSGKGPSYRFMKKDDVPEAEEMYQISKNRGKIKTENIKKEVRSRDTVQNIIFSLDILKKYKGIKEITLPLIGVDDKNYITQKRIIGAILKRSYDKVYVSNPKCTKIIPVQKENITFRILLGTKCKGFYSFLLYCRQILIPLIKFIKKIKNKNE